MSERMVRSHCPFCSMQCGLELKLTEKEPGWEVRPSSTFPVATGRLCQKGYHSPRHAVHPDRITSPLVRRVPAGGSIEAAPWQPSGWEAALDSIGQTIRSLQDRYGKDSIAVYGGGSLTNEVSYLLGKFARVALRSRYIDYNGRYCMSSAAAAQIKAFGMDRGLTFPLSDIPKTDYVILAGANIAECQPTLMPYLLEAKKNGAVIVTIDPRLTLTSKMADIHVMLQPGFDSVFVNGLLHTLIAEELYDAQFVERTVGFEELKQAVQSFPAERVSAITGIYVEKIRTIARGFAAAKNGIVLTARGIEQQVNGVEHTLSYINLSLLCGKIGRPASGFGAITGQANGQGGREHGQKADQLPGYRLIEDPEARRHVAAVWGVEPESLPGKGVSAYELFDKVMDGDIKGMIVLGSNPLVSSPNARRVEEALKKLELLVVVDLFETETARYAHWLLPGSSFLEAEGTITNVEGRVFHRPKALDTPGTVKLDMHIIRGLADRLGAGKHFAFRDAEEVFDELCRATAGGKADYSGMTYKRLQSEGGLYWPCPEESHPGTPRLFEHRFAHPDGKARLHAIEPGIPAETPCREYPYILSTGRVGSQYLSGAQTRRTEPLHAKAPVPMVEIHPSLAERIGLRPNDYVRLATRRGSAAFPFRITENIHPTTVFVPFHWGGALSINRLTNDALHPLSRMPEFKICAVQVRREERMT